MYLFQVQCSIKGIHAACFESPEMLYSEVTGLPECCFQPPCSSTSPQISDMVEESDFTTIDSLDEVECETCIESVEMTDFEILHSDHDACGFFDASPEDWDDLEEEDFVAYDMETCSEFDFGEVQNILVNIAEDAKISDSSLQRLFDDIIIIGIK